MLSRVACLLGRHRWSGRENRETQGWDFRCGRCGKERSTFPGDPGFRPHGRQGSDGRTGWEGNGR